MIGEGKILRYPGRYTRHWPDDAAALEQVHRIGHPRQHLKEFSGVLQADAYAGFGHLYQAGHIHEAACMAHVRRKFYGIQVANGSPIASEAIQRIGALYDIEREIRGKRIELRHQIRQTRARPLVECLL